MMKLSLKQTWLRFVAYIKVLLFSDLDQVKETAAAPKAFNQSGSRRLNRIYLFPYATVLFCVADMAWSIAENDFILDHQGMPTFLLHYCFPPEYWPQGDYLLGFCTVCALIVYPILLVDPMLDPKLLMHLKVDKELKVATIVMNKQVLNSEEAQKIYTFRRKSLQIAPIVLLFVWIPIELFFMWSFFNKWTHSLRDYIMSVATILYFINVCISNVFMSFHFLMSIAYYRLRQNGKLRRLAMLKSQILGRATKFGRQSRRVVWARFWALHSEMLALLREIPMSNHFWSKYLTTYFLIYICTMTYLAYTFFFVKSNIDLIKKSFLLLLASNFMTILLVVTTECSSIVQKNIKYYREAIQIALHLQSVNPPTLLGKLKIDSVCSQFKNIPRISYRLLNGYRIDGNMFQVIFSYTSLLFMMIFRQEQKIE